MVDNPSSREFLRPNLDYQYIYDVCAVQSQAHTPIAVIASSSFHAHELGSRLPNAVVYTSYEQALNELVTLAPHSIIWAEPETSSAEKWLALIRDALPSNGILCVMVSGRLVTRLSEWRAGLPLGGQKPLGWTATQALLRPFKLENTFAFHGPVSIVCGLISDMLMRSGRMALADRWHYRMRASFNANGWEVPFSTLGIMVVRR